MMQPIHKGCSNRLRIGRYSQVGHAYLVTTVTHERHKIFADFAAARLLINVLRAESALGNCTTLAFVVMPDHLHWLLRLDKGTLSALVGRVKSISAKRLGGTIWQTGFHDQALRREEDLQSMARYVIANPLRAGLASGVGLYPHWDAIWL